MGSDLTARAATSRALGGQVDAGPGADVTAATFTAKALHFTAIPDQFPTSGALVPTGQTAPPLQKSQPKPAEREIAHITRQEPKPFRLSNGSVVQRRTGFAAYPDRTITVIAERPLAPADNGTYRPAGAWQLVRRETHTLPQRASRTKGTVTADTPHSTPITPDEPGTDESARFPDGAEAIAYLPAPVRRSIYARVPTPSTFDGKVVQYQDDNRYEVVVTRADKRTSLVVLATRPERSTTWDVTMLTYDLSVTTTRVEGRP